VTHRFLDWEPAPQVFLGFLNILDDLRLGYVDGLFPRRWLAAPQTAGGIGDEGV